MPLCNQRQWMMKNQKSYRAADKAFYKVADVVHGVGDA